MTIYLLVHNFSQNVKEISMTTYFYAFKDFNDAVEAGRKIAMKESEYKNPKEAIDFGAEIFRTEFGNGQSCWIESLELL